MAQTLMRAPGGNRYDLLVPRSLLEDSVLVTPVLGKAALPTWVFRGALALIWAPLSLSVQVGCRARTDPLSCDDHTDHPVGMPWAEQWSVQARPVP